MTTLSDASTMPIWTASDWCVMALATLSILVLAAQLADHDPIHHKITRTAATETTTAAQQCPTRRCNYPAAVWVWKDTWDGAGFNWTLVKVCHGCCDEGVVRFGWVRADIDSELAAWERELAGGEGA